MTAEPAPDVRERLAELPRELGALLRDQYAATAGRQTRLGDRSRPDRWGLIDEWERRARADHSIMRALSALRGPAWKHGVNEFDVDRIAQWSATMCGRSLVGRETLPAEFPRDLFGGMPDAMIARRVGDWTVWRRVLRASYLRTIEHDLRGRGIVRSGKAAYVSDWAVGRYRARRKQNRRKLEASELVDQDTGETLPLVAAVDASVSNPAIRRGELMARARGFEEVAADHGHVALFVTLTTPSRFHPQRYKGGPNPNYDGSTARDAQTWLRAQWARARAKLKRLSVLYYGVRVAEPHHDGTPHWHVLMFAPAHERARIETVLRGYWLADAGDEPGADKHRVEVTTIDASKGSAVGYLAKYVAKNIDGYRVGDDLEADAPAEHTADRVLAWASTHGIRQFQQVGGPPVGLWRELRRVRDPVPEAPAVEAARAPADAGDYAGFVRAVGGVEVGRDTRVVVLQRAPDEPLNRYGEPRPPVPVGVAEAARAAVRVLTRARRWLVVFRDALASLSPPPWTRVNNCTVAAAAPGAGDPGPPPFPVPP